MSDFHLMPAPQISAIFLDRDGTINVDVSYLSHPSQLELLPATGSGLRRLQEKYALVVITNQSGIARGILDEDQLAAIHRRLDEMLAAVGVTIRAYYICPHHPDYGEPPYRQDCTCRKPKTGLYERAAAELNIDLSSSWAIGDRLRDCVGPLKLGCRAMLLNPNAQEAEKAQEYPDIVTVTNMDEAADIILSA